MRKKGDDIPLHKLRDRHAGGISVRYIDSMLATQTEAEAELMAAHRDDHYIFLFLQCGVTKFMVDFEEVTLAGTAVQCILPGQVHFYISSVGAAGWFMAVDSLLVDEQYRQLFEADILKIHPIAVAEAQAQHLRRCAQALQLLLDDDTALAPQTVINNLTSACIGLVAEVYKSKEQSSDHAHNRAALITHQFRQLLNKNYKTEKSPAQYAADLNLSLTYLNECVKATTGISVSHWIQQEVVMEVKRMLYYTTISVKEIAYALGYDDHGYLSRMFSKATGMAPGHFRKAYRG